MILWPVPLVKQVFKIVKGTQESLQILPSADKNGLTAEHMSHPCPPFGLTIPQVFAPDPQ